MALLIFFISQQGIGRRNFHILIFTCGFSHCNFAEVKVCFNCFIVHSNLNKFYLFTWAIAKSSSITIVENFSFSATKMKAILKN